VLKNEFEDASYLLYQCGPEPPVEELDGRHRAIISIPPSDAAAVSQTTHIPHLETLGTRTQNKGYLGDPQYISSPYVNQMMDSGDITVVVSNSSDTTALTELLASTGPDLVSFVGSYNVPESLNNTILVSAFNQKIDAGVYEWNKYFSAIFNLEARANDSYEEITSNYIALPKMLLVLQPIVICSLLFFGHITVLYIVVGMLAHVQTTIVGMHK
jgi:hypothetical protein